MAQKTTLNDGGVQIVRQQGVANGTVINDGLQFVEKDGQAQ
ncbi:hypothetical protein [Cronobacter malonaticus]|nr:hypothetical protein [Cronobacter malonaticus]